MIPGYCLTSESIEGRGRQERDLDRRCEHQFQNYTVCSVTLECRRLRLDVRKIGD